MVYVPDLDVLFPATISFAATQYLLTVAHGTDDVPACEGGYRWAPDWLVDAVHREASEWWCRRRATA